MKKLGSLLVFLISLGACGACSGKSDAVAVVKVTTHEQENVDQSLAIFTAYGSGHGCAVEGNIFTAQHVMRRRGTTVDLDEAAWSDAAGRYGYARVTSRRTAKDLVALEAVGSSEPEYHVLASPAKVGDPIFWVDYNFTSAKVAYDPVFRTARIQKRIAQHYILTDTPKQGASGGCLFDINGRALGVIAWGLKMYNGEEVGAAVEILPEDLHQ